MIDYRQGMPEQSVLAKAARRWSSAHEASALDVAANPFRIDRDRIASSPFFARLGGVTQVISPSGSGLLVHNRLTHSLKVAQVGRAIAERLLAHPAHAEVLTRLGGCDPDVVEAAALAHDLGHPPFGHLGEYVLDRLARHRLGLPDGFEGNAQSFRIVTTNDVHGPAAVGLDLTVAVRAAMLKYPWTRLSYPTPHPRTMSELPRGAGEPRDAPGTGSAKFSAYVSELDDLMQSRAFFQHRIPVWQQTVEAAVMDTADDIAYAIHDVEDFHRVGVLQHATVAAEFDHWQRDAVELATWSRADLQAKRNRPGCSLELLRRRLHRKDSWIVDDDAFAVAVARVRTDLVDDLLAMPFDGSVDAERLVAAFSAQWISRLVDGVIVVAEPGVRAAHVTVTPQCWHETQVLKFVHHRFVLERPDLALHQRGQARLLTALIEALEQWLADRYERSRLPRRLHDLAELAAGEYRELLANTPEVLAGATGEIPEGQDAIRRLARGRAVVDYVSSLTDTQAVAMLEALSGRTGQLWTDAFVL